jgi:glutamyl-tRNA reductase
MHDDKHKNDAGGAETRGALRSLSWGSVTANTEANRVNVFVAGLSYKTAPVEFRERLAVPPWKLRCAGCRLKVAGELSELVVLSTCNRVEIYGVTARRHVDLEALLECLAPDAAAAAPYFYVHHGADALTHLFSVTSGLDSMVIGETEITGQVKHAYQVAQDAKLTGKVLNRVFQTALQAAKEVRTQTSIGRGATSVGSVAVQLAEKIFGGAFSEKTVMIIGAGKMGEACIRHLARTGVRTILVSNRSFDRAQNLADEFGGRAIRFDDSLGEMAQADIVVSSTGCPETILHRDQIEQVLAARRNRPLVLIDIAVPRDISPDVQLLPNVYLYDIDDLQAVVRENVRHREEELERCRAIVRRRTAEVMERLCAAEKRAAEARDRDENAWLLYGVPTRAVWPLEQRRFA